MTARMEHEIRFFPTSSRHLRHFRVVLGNFTVNLHCFLKISVVTQSSLSRHSGRLLVTTAVSEYNYVG